MFGSSVMEDVADRAIQGRVNVSRSMLTQVHRALMKTDTVLRSTESFLLLYLRLGTLTG